MKRLCTICITLAVIASLVSCKKGNEVTHIESLEFSNVKNGKFEMTEEETFRIDLQILPIELDTMEVTWTSSNEKTATVKHGKVYALWEGKSTITASAGGKEISANLTVKRIEMTDFNVNATTLYVTEGENIEIPITTTPANANKAHLVYTVGSKDIAEINNGVLYGKKEGTTYVSIKIDDRETPERKYMIKVQKQIPLEGLSLTNATLEAGDTKQLTLTKTPSNATTSLTWTSLNTSVATVSTSGVVTGVTAGTTTIKVSDKSGIEATCTVIVNPATPKSIVLTSNNINITTIGGTQQLTATVKPDIAADKSVTWKSANTSVATVSSSGLVKAVGYGSTTITATTSNGIQATANVSVGVTITSISVQGTTTYSGNQHMNITGDKTLTLVMSPSTATVSDVTFTIEPLGDAEQACATISTSGKLTVERLGDAVVTIKSKTNPSVYQKVYIHNIQTKKETFLSGYFCNGSYVGYTYATGKSVLIYRITSTPNAKGSIFTALWSEREFPEYKGSIPEDTKGSSTDGETNTSIIISGFGCNFATICKSRGGYWPAVEECKAIYKSRKMITNAFTAIPSPVGTLSGMTLAETLEETSSSYSYYNLFISSTYSTGIRDFFGTYRGSTGTEQSQTISNSYPIWTIVKP